MTTFATKTCAECGQLFEPRSPRALICGSDECKKSRHRKHVVDSAARKKGQGRTVNTARQEQRAHGQSGSDALARMVQTVLTDAASRLAPDSHGRRENVDMLFFSRLQAVRDALKAGEPAPARDALIDLIASATAWATKIDLASDSPVIPGPSWPEPKVTVSRPSTPLVAPSSQLAPVRTQPGAGAVDHYIETLSARCADLDTEQALDRLERLLGLGA